MILNISNEVCLDIQDELRTGMEMIGERVTERQLNELLQLADTDHDGRINYEGNVTDFLCIFYSISRNKI